MDWSIILSSCIVAITTIFSIFLKEFIQARSLKSKTCVVNYTKKNENVEKAINYLSKALKSDRVYIYEFHNGDHFYSGTHQQKFSCTYESLGAGVSSEALALQDLRVSTFNYFIKSVVNENKFFIPDSGEVSNPLIKSWLDTRGIASTFSFPIKSLNKNIIGIISIDFTKQKDELTCEEIQLVIDQSKIICGYLI
mgnify:FL=1